MKDIEKLISPLIENQFPALYQEEGPNFVAFVKAYYEWLESPLQTLTLLDATGFDVGDTVTQTLDGSAQVEGVILEKDGKVLTVRHDTVEQFRCLTRCNVTYPVFSSSGAETYIDVSTSGNILYHARNLGTYRDIDSTIDRFIVNFKEKYLKNIQFDTATNKKLLVKNSLDLYRSKGTERSVDLFFKLIYGTAAEVKYPADNILRPSDGIYEKPEYLEISFSEFNVDYVGKQIIGSLSGARAFVEKYVRRRAGRGYVNLLYISGRVGDFRNGEVIGINVNNIPDYTRPRSQLIGSLKRVTVIDKGRDFRVGDIVTIESPNRGRGGLARVVEVDVATGLIDFIFLDGGYGYTLDASSLISEKVISIENIIADKDSDRTFRLFEQLAEPLVNVAFTSATANLAVGDTMYRYAANGKVTATGKVIDVEQVGANGSVTISHTNGVFKNTATYYTTSNAGSFYANTIEDRTIGGKVMGIPTVYRLSLSGQVGRLEVGQNVYQKNTSTVFARGTINSISQSTTGNVVVISNARGAFKNSVELEKETYATGTGSITANVASSVVVGSGTTFDNNYIGAVLYQTPNTSTNVAIGTVVSITNSTSLMLSSNATVNVAGNNHSYGLNYPLVVASNTGVYANVDLVGSTVGVYEIKKFVNTLRYSSANNDELLASTKIFQYNTSGNVISEGMLITVDHNSGTGSGNLTFFPIRGYFAETDRIYTEGNTSQATVVTYSVSNSGGDYIASENSRLVTQTTNTVCIPTLISQGSGASFGVATIGDTEVIFIGTDLIGSNNVGHLDYDRKILTVSSNSGFAVGDDVQQTVNKIAFNANSGVNATSGFITILNANTLFTVGDNLRYEVAAGNTALTGLIPGDTYHVRFANTTGLILSYPYRKTDYINTSNFSTFANNKVNEEGHYLYKQVYGTVFELGTGVIKVKDVFNFFGNTSSNTTANTTNAANSNILKVGGTANTDIQNITVYTTLVVANQAYTSLPIRHAAFGFPKNPQGEIKDLIYSCLTFNRFEIGTIGALSQVDPGSGYTADPYVLAYQPYISAFDRNDFIINISNTSRPFVTGERVNQTVANLIYYDLKVTSGVYGNTYDEKQTNVNTKEEIVSADDFVLSPSNTVTFNTSDDVNSNTDFIAISGNPFSSNDYVRYYTDTGNTALTGLSNNTFYYVKFANSTGITLSSTAGGANINVTQSSNVAIFNSGGDISNSANFITIATANTLFANGNQVRYYTDANTIVIDGLSNNELYFVRYANSTGLALSLTSGGANVDISSLSGGANGHYLRFYSNTETGHNIRNYVNELANGQIVLYRTPAANTVIDGLSNNSFYYVVSANTIGFKVSASLGGAAVGINAASGSAEQHIFSTVPGYLPGDKVYQNTATVVNAFIQSVFSNSTGDFVRVTGNTGAINVSTSNTLFSYTNPYVNASVSNVSLYQITSTAKGIVKGGNTSTLFIKRLTFENTFQSNSASLLVGDVSGAQATIIGVSEDPDELYPIGLNAEVEANVTIANGQVVTLDVVDSGLGYGNAEVLQFVGSNGAIAGTIKTEIDGHGISRGYYRSSKGFLSEDMYIHDGDYYQEYSYEVLSKLSVERYGEMFKKVMHVAGAKFFGSALVVEEANVALALSSIATGQQIQFNAATDVSSANETIELDIEGRLYEFDALADVNQETEFFTLTNAPTTNPVTLSNGSMVQYISNTGNYIGIGDGASTLSNAAYYYVVFSNTSGIKISTTLGGSVLNVNTSAVPSEFQYFRQIINPFANGDSVTYTTAASNTALQANIVFEFYTNNTVNATSTSHSYIKNIVESANNRQLRVGDHVFYTRSVSPTANVGLTDAQEYVVSFANSTAIRLSNTTGYAVNVVTSNVTPAETHFLTIARLSNNQTYYVVNTTPNTVKLALQPGTLAINISSNTTTSGANTAGHYLTKTVEE